MENILIRLEQLIAAGQPIETPQWGIPFRILPEGSTLQSLERQSSVPARQRAIFTAQRLQDFINYASVYRAESTAFFVDPESLNAMAVIDYDPGWGEHKAILKMVKTPVYQSIVSHRDTWGQLELCEWLEDYGRLSDNADNNSVITAKRLADKDETADADGFVKIELPLAIETLKTVKYKKGQEVVSQIGELSATHSVPDTLQLTGAENQNLPGRFTISAPLYEGTGNREIEIRLQVANIGTESEIKTGFKLRIVAHDALKQAVATELENRIRELENAAVYVGNVQINHANN